MKIKFEAQKVSYSEALDRDIIQISFEQKDSDDLIDNPYKYLMISVNYEFPPCTPTVEWCDGEDFNGGSEIENYQMNENSLQLNLKDNVSFDISFNTDLKTIEDIKNFLAKIT
jgi:hypothetical protein